VIFVLLSVVFSVLVSVLLKLARRHDIDMVQAIACNYVVAAALCMSLLQPSVDALRMPDTPWLALVLLGVLLPGVFVALAASVRRAGIVRTDVAQRLSLFISLIAAFLFFGDVPAPGKLAGIGLGIVAVLCILARPADRRTTGAHGDWLFPLVVCVGFGAIDILFKRIALAGAPFATALLAAFVIAAVVCLLVVGIGMSRGRMQAHWRHAGFGVLLGTANFANILFYIRGHQALPDHPAMVFSTMNIGVVAVGTLAGTVLFDERPSRLNGLGIVLALLAIGVMTTV
jgi:drug/metabolite transporter (DMT)-like permease